ncbi:MAG: amidohydrolase family protein, partial [Planctomycetota bacterium]
MQALLIAFAGALAFAQETVETAGSPGKTGVDLVIRAGRVHVGDGRVLENMRIRIRNGKVVGLLEDEGRLAPGAEVLDYRRQTVIPGLVAAHTDLCAIDNQRNLTPDIVAADNFDYYRKYDKLVATGLTTVYLSPGLSRLMPGRGSVVKLAGERVEDRLLLASSALCVHLSARSRQRIPMIFDPTPMPTSDDPLLPAERQRGSARYSQMAVLEAALDQARADGDSALASLREVLSGSLPVRLAAERGADVLHGLDLFSKLGARVVLEKPEEALPLELRLARQAIPVVVKMPLRPSTVTLGDHPLESDPTAATPDLAGELSQAGIPVCIVPATDKDLGKLRMIAGLAARYGMADAKALDAVTIEAARVLGVADRVGSIEAGKDADLLVLTGKPFDSRSQVDAVFIDGIRVHERKDKSPVYAIRAGRVLLGDGTQQHDSTVVVRGGKIHDVGPYVPVPPGAKVYSYPDAVLTPGFIAAATKLGLHADSGSTVRAGPEVDVAAALEAGDPAFRPALEAGITSLFVTPDDGSSVSGRVAAVKTDGSEKRFVTRAVTGLRYVLTKGGKSGKAKILAAIKKARDYIEPKKPEPKKDEKKDGKKKPEKPQKKEPKKPVDPISGKWQTQVVIQGMPARVVAEMKLAGTELSCTLTVSVGPMNLPPIELTGTFKENKLELEGTGPPPV